ncbi:hypothetical protein HUJ05_010060 [Dendroctonus ponderosae]|nr:hypothetical protein HUJ05_010060 [Dendroctonus ponderosae]
MNGEDEHEIWLSGWEQQCCEAIQNQPAYEQSLAAENEYFQRRVWTSFQDSATAIAQLYREVKANSEKVKVRDRSISLRYSKCDSKI